MIKAHLLAAAMEHKYGPCCDTAVRKDGTYSITRWDKDVAGIDEPDESLIEQAIAEYEAAQTTERQELKAAFQAITDPNVKKLFKYVIGELNN